MRLPKLPVALLVGFCLFALAAFAGGAVLSVGYGIALKNTRELLYGNADLSIAALRQGITGHLDPVASAVDDLAGILARDPRAATDDTALATILQAAMTGLPQVTALAVVDHDYRVFRISRDPARASLKWANWSEDRQFRATVDKAMQVGDGHWGAPFYAETARISLLNYYKPLTGGDGRMKALAAVISLEQLSDWMIALSDRPQQEARIRPFVLYGRDRVLAHPLFLAGYPGLSDAEPLPKLTDFTDPVLASLWRTDPSTVEGIETSLLHNADARIIDSGGTRYLAIYTGLSGYGPQELLLGAYVATSEARVQLDRLAILPQVAAVLLVVVLGLAWIIGRLVGRPARQLAAAADHIRHFQFDQAPLVEDTMIREMSAAAGAFNSMTGALRQFAAYVPERLVHRLVALGPDRSIRPTLRSITVMFTDIAGFTTLSEPFPADQTARLLNRHFEIVGGAIEREDGTIDKFLGDGLMAFWGAPIHQSDAAERAVRAALAVTAAIAEDNRLRRQHGEAPIRMRIGLHSGPAVVGNIGFPGRINYTIVGDTVNAGQRLEGLAREFDDGRDVTVLLSGDTAKALGPDFRLTPCGSRAVKGRGAQIEVFRLEP
ncbi:adenylate/guanylate cyclase domain-containing protein [Thalassobaculum sp.]|uniref:adenylate/guanylate cyclase domain-containing protein n=1 Tax=Thalassobaculum sp. TaxID=2022740 RepID=UPI0032EBBB6B